MIRTPLFVLLAASFIQVNAATGGKGSGGASPAAQVQAKSTGGGGGGGGGNRYQDPRKAPPMDPKRKVNEQDCSRPIDLAAGNLKCQ